MMSMEDLHELVRGLVRQYKAKRVLINASSENCSSISLSLAKPSVSLSLMSETTTSTPNTVEFDDVERLASGEETRCTLMIKRIPRKYTLAELRQEIDETLGETGLYDLLYLPVDSAKMTNRGYAFINFIAPASVARFLQAFLGRQWNESNKRRKIAVICWANVQGKDSTLAHIKTEER